MFLKKFDENYEHLIETEIVKFCNTNDAVPLLGAITSNCSRNTHNCFSDIDFFLICSFKKTLNEVLLLKDIVKDVDFLIFDIDFLIEGSCGDETGTCARNDNRPTDYYKAIIFEALCSEFLWDYNCYVKDNISILEKSFTKKTILNYFYVRAAGNLKSNLANPANVPMQKYILTIHGICIMKWLLDFNSLPPYNIDILLEKYRSDFSDVFYVIEELLQINRWITNLQKTDQVYHSSKLGFSFFIKEEKRKKIVRIERISVLNEFLERQLESIRVRLDNTDEGSFLKLNCDSLLYQYINK